MAAAIPRTPYRRSTRLGCGSRRLAARLVRSLRCRWRGREPNAPVAAVTEGLILRRPAPAEGEPSVLADHLALRPDDLYAAAHEQRPVRTRLDRRLRGGLLLSAVVEPAEVQRPRRAGQNRPRDRIGIGSVHVDPRPRRRPENAAESSVAVAAVDAEARLPVDLDRVVPVHPPRAALVPRHGLLAHPAATRSALLGMPFEIGAHERADRHQRETAPANVLERPRDQLGANALTFERRVDLGVDERQLRGLGVIGDNPDDP